jgi:polyphosphate kinase 2 (PPK2 family)
MVNDYYQRYLSRTPSQGEMTAWLEYFARGKSEEDLPVTLLSSTEFYERAGSTDARFIDRMFRVVVNRAPSNEETNQWLQKLLRLGPQGRSTVVKEFWRAASPK